MRNAHVVEEPVRASNVLEPLESKLRNDGPKLPTRGRDPMCGRPVPGGERFAGYDKRCRIRPEVLEEVRKAIQDHEGRPPAR